MNIKKLTAGLVFCATVEGKRQRYHVFEGKSFFFVCSFSRTKPKAGNFNIVDVEATRYTRRLVGGEGGVTESPRDCRRLHSLRGWGHVTTKQIFPRGPRASRPDGVRAQV